MPHISGRDNTRASPISSAASSEQAETSTTAGRSSSRVFAASSPLTRRPSSSASSSAPRQAASLLKSGPNDSLATRRMLARLYPPGNVPGASALDAALVAGDLGEARRLLEEERQGRTDRELWDHSRGSQEPGSVRADRPDIRRAMLVLCDKESRDTGAMSHAMHQAGFKSDDPAIVSVLRALPHHSPKRRMTTTDPSYLQGPQPPEFDRIVTASGGVPLNNNERATFPNGKKIVCQEIAPTWTDAVARDGTFDYEQFSLDRLPRTVPQETRNGAFLRLPLSPSVHLVTTEDFGRVMAREFEDMQRLGESRRGKDVYASGHMMGAALKITTSDAKAPEHRLKLFDPNVSAGHKLVTSAGGLDDIAPLTLEQMLPTPVHHEAYFGREDAPLVTIAAPPLPGWNTPLPKEAVDDKGRAFTEPWTGPISAALMHRLFCVGAQGELERLKPRILEHFAAAPREQAIALLAPKDNGGRPAFFAMADYGHAHTLRSMCELARSLDLTAEEAQQVIPFQGEKDNASMSARLLDLPLTVKFAEVYLHEALALLPDREQRIRALNAPNQLGAPSVFQPMSNANDDMIDLYLGAAQAHGLSSDEARSMLNATGFAQAPDDPFGHIYGVSFPGFAQIYAEVAHALGQAEDPGVQAVLAGVKKAHEQMSALGNQTNADLLCGEIAAAGSPFEQRLRSERIHALRQAAALHDVDVNRDDVLNIAEVGFDLVKIDKHDAAHALMKYGRSRERQNVLVEAFKRFGAGATSFRPMDEGEQNGEAAVDHCYELNSVTHGKCHVQFRFDQNTVRELRVRDAAGHTIASMRPYAKAGG
jgi:hypothetical protein